MRVLVTLAVALHAVASAQDQPVLRPGETVSGFIADGDPVVETDSIRATMADAPVVGRAYRFEVAEPGTYRAEFRSCFFDAYLVLRDAKGGVLAEDDDGLIGTQSQIVFEVTSDSSSFTLEACALHGGRGSFDLSAASGAPPGRDSALAAVAAIEDVRRCVQAREALLGPDDPAVATGLNDLCMLLYRQHAYSEARSACERALAIREKALGPDDPDVATSLNNLARLLQTQGDATAARPLFERSLTIREKALGPDDLLVALSLNNLGSLLVEQGDRDAARPLLERALAIRETVLGPVHSDVARSLNNLATLLMEQGDWAAARPLLERSLDVERRVLGPDASEVGTTLDNLATVLSEQGDLQGARALYERALAIQERALGPDDPAVATTMSNLAELLRTQGDYSRARPLAERALAIHEKVSGANSLFVAVDQGNLGLLLRATGDHAGAETIFRRALAVQERLLGADHPDVATTLENLAAVLREEKRSADARMLAERALAINEASWGPESENVAVSLNTLATSLVDMRDYTAARPLYERALAIWERAAGPDSYVVATALNNLALVERWQGDGRSARALYERAVPIYEQALGAAHPGVMTILAGLAMVELDLGDRVAAVATLARVQQGRAENVSLFLSGASEADAASYFATWRWIVELAQSPVLLADQPTEACASLLAWKGQILRAARTSRAVLRDGLGLAGRDLADQLQGLSAALSASANGPRRPGGAADAARLDVLVRKRQELERELSAKTAGLLPEVPDWSRLRELLPARAALVDVFVHRDYDPAHHDADHGPAFGLWSEPRVGAWITRRDAQAPVHVDLGPATAIESAVHATLQGISRGRGAQSLAPAAGPGLRRLLWDPLAAQLGGIDTVIISPDGVLAALPFESLTGDDGRYLVEDRSFIYLTDPTDIARLPPRSELANDSLLAVGGLDYDHAEGMPASTVTATHPEPATSPAPPRGGWSQTWRALVGTQLELEAITARHSASFSGSHDTRLQDSAATERRLKELLPQFSIVHLATHGYFNPDGLPSLDEAARRETDRHLDEPAHPEESVADVLRRLQGYSPGLLSGLVCSGANAALPPDGDDGYLTAEEVGWLDLSHVDLVVLSACDTGLGRPQSGEGLIGLRRAFLEAGARTVISSLWSVPDQETAELMGLFYANLWEKKLGRHESLRAAQLEMIRRNRERFGGDARPATWGAFVLDGDWR